MTYPSEQSKLSCGLTEGTCERAIKLPLTYTLALPGRSVYSDKLCIFACPTPRQIRYLPTTKKHTCRCTFGSTFGIDSHVIVASSSKVAIVKLCGTPSLGMLTMPGTRNVALTCPREVTVNWRASMKGGGTNGSSSPRRLSGSGAAPGMMWLLPLPPPPKRALERNEDEVKALLDLFFGNGCDTIR